MEPSGAAIDGREVRGAQAVIALLVLGGFVFGWPVLVVVAGIFSALGAFVGPHTSPVHALYRATMAPHLDDPRVFESPHAVRALDVLGVILCGTATLFFLVGFDPVGWLVALAEAAVAAIAASTGFNAAVMLRDRLRHR